MELFLVQHGEAKPETVDPERPLTDRGAETVERMATWASRAGVEVAQIRHSGKRRAEQTAAILAEQLKPAKGVIAVAGLKPNDDVHAMGAALGTEREPLMLVGHLPFLSRLAGLLDLSGGLQGNLDHSSVGHYGHVIPCFNHGGPANRDRVSFFRYLLPE